MEACDLQRAVLSRSTWHRAQVVKVTAMEADLNDAKLAGARFERCDLREAHLGASVPDSAAGAVFVACDLRSTDWTGRDLRGASFVDCKLFGARGAPDLDGALIVRPDLSPTGDGRAIGSHEEALAHWRLSCGAPLA